MGLFTGVDLHSNNGYYGIINENEERIFKKKLPNHLPTVLSNLEPFREDIVGIVVESTYNWYWLVDGLMEEGYKVHLANPSAIKQYEKLYLSKRRTTGERLIEKATNTYQTENQPHLKLPESYYSEHSSKNILQ